MGAVLSGAAAAVSPYIIPVVATIATGGVGYGIHRATKFNQFSSFWHKPETQTDSSRREFYRDLFETFYDPSYPNYLVFNRMVDKILSDLNHKISNCFTEPIIMDNDAIPRLNLAPGLIDEIDTGYQRIRESKQLESNLRAQYNRAIQGHYQQNIEPNIQKIEAEIADLNKSKSEQEDILNENETKDADKNDGSTSFQFVSGPSSQTPEQTRDIIETLNKSIDELNEQKRNLLTRRQSIIFLIFINRSAI